MIASGLLAVVAFLTPFFLLDNSSDPLSLSDNQTTSTISNHQNNNNQGNGYSVSYSYIGDPLDIPDLIEIADAAIIGVVGEILAREYPRAYTQGNYTPEEWSSLNDQNSYVEEYRIAFHDISVEETLFGDIPSRFPLLRDDVEYFHYSDLTILKPGDRVLMFLAIRPGDPNQAKSYDTFYTTADNGIFDLEGDRAYPRLPIAFEETKETYYHQTDDPLRPFFELGKLKEAINQAK